MSQKSTIKKPKYRAVLFDLDGVLVDSYEVWRLVFNETLIHFGHRPISRLTFRKNWGQSTEEDVRIFMAERTVEEVRTKLNSIFDNYAERYLKVDSDARPILRALSGMGIKLACVTNSHRRITIRMLRRTKLLQYFDTVVTADDVMHPKPAPDMLHEACRRLHIHGRTCLFVGDTAVDIGAGKAAKITTAGLGIKGDFRIVRLRHVLRLVRQ